MLTMQVDNAQVTLDNEVEDLLAEIREINLSYLMLAQKLIRKDKSQALVRLGVNEEVADIIGEMSVAQTIKAASDNTLLCNIRDAEPIVWKLLTQPHKPSMRESSSRLHAMILKAGNIQMAA